MLQILVENLNQYNKLMQYLQDNGFMWRSGRYPTENRDDISDNINNYLRERKLLIVLLGGKITLSRLDDNFTKYIHFYDYMADKTEFIEWE